MKARQPATDDLPELRIAQTEEARRAYREPIVTTPSLAESISDAILYDEPTRQWKKDGSPASARLNAMNVRFKSRLPWAVAVSFARAIQQPALAIWRGEQAHVSAAQYALYQPSCLQPGGGPAAITPPRWKVRTDETVQSTDAVHATRTASSAVASYEPVECEIDYGRDCFAACRNCVGRQIVRCRQGRSV